MSVTASEPFRQRKPRGFFALFGSYARDLRGWVASLATGYGIAAALMLGGVLALFGAIAVGAVALFHVIELRYGTNIAFAALGGGLIVLALILLLAGWLMLQRRTPMPRPERQFRAAKQMLVGSTISRAVTALRDTEAGRPDATTQVLLGAAAAVAVGWLVFHHTGPAASRPQVRR
jgi:hypothetical protein